jgi:hypothetical protein
MPAIATNSLRIKEVADGNLGKWNFVFYPLLAAVGYLVNVLSLIQLK